MLKKKHKSLLPFLDKLCKVHGNNHPELFEINELFQRQCRRISTTHEKRRIDFISFYQRNDQRHKKSWNYWQTLILEP